MEPPDPPINSESVNKLKDELRAKADAIEDEIAVLESERHVMLAEAEEREESLRPLQRRLAYINHQRMLQAWGSAAFTAADEPTAESSVATMPANVSATSISSATCTTTSAATAALAIASAAATKPASVSAASRPTSEGRSVVVTEGERVRVLGCDTAGDVLMRLKEQGINGDYLTAGRMGERLDEARRVSEVEGELWLRVRGAGGARGDAGANVCGIEAAETHVMLLAIAEAVQSSLTQWKSLTSSTQISWTRIRQVLKEPKLAKLRARLQVKRPVQQFESLLGPLVEQVRSRHLLTVPMLLSRRASLLTGWLLVDAGLGKPPTNGGRVPRLQRV